jgi:hypothetical protein
VTFLLTAMLVVATATIGHTRSGSTSSDRMTGDKKVETMGARTTAGDKKMDTMGADKMGEKK